jgi:hypothetical protein
MFRMCTRWLCGEKSASQIRSLKVAGRKIINCRGMPSLAPNKKQPRNVPCEELQKADHAPQDQRLQDYDGGPVGKMAAGCWSDGKSGGKDVCLTIILRAPEQGRAWAGEWRLFVT